MWHIRAILACKGPVPKRIGIFIAVHKVNITVFRSRATFINVQTITGVSALIQPSPKTITVVIRKVEIGIICMHEKCNVNDFVERFGVSRRTITSDIVVLTRKHNIKSKSGPHGGIEIDRDLKTDEVPYLTDFETSWLKRKYDEAEIEEDRIAAHSILRRFSL